MARSVLRARLAQARATGARPKRRSGKSGKSGRKPTRWETGEFVAVDGEGFSEGPEQAFIVGDKRTVYRGREHFYAYLAASDGSSIYSKTRLRLGECLRFLCAIQERNRNAILVAFGGSYDVLQMVAHDLDVDGFKTLVGKDPRFRSYRFNGGDGFVYFLEYRPRKCLTVKRWPEGARRFAQDDKGRWKATPHLVVKLWDVWGFFQGSFSEAMRKWLPGDPDYEFIRTMKGERSTFERHELETIKRYNAAELRCLVKIMEALRGSINDLGLKITRWDGAGAIAAALLQLHKVKEHKGASPPDVFEAARRAYSGGHIETCKVGRHIGAVHHYDITSAYPDQFRRLPSLAWGLWARGEGEPPDGFAMVEVEFEFPEGAPFYPLFYRTERGAVLYPSSGRGTYWLAEYRAAQAWADKLGGYVRPLRWWKWEPWGETIYPFAWVEPLFVSRFDDIQAGRFGPEKTKKTGLNSLYGKTAQQIGWKEDDEGNVVLPPYFQLEWAGAVTAGCRAQMVMAALQAPSSVIGFATDGLFTLEPLELDCPKRKTLGAWEYKRHDGITMVMPGVYWLHDGEEVQGFSRGFDKKEMKDADFVIRGWAKREQTIPVQLTRLVGIGSAISSPAFWEMRGRFMTTTRQLRLDGDNSKRYAISLDQHKPHRGLVDTIPKDHELARLLGVEPSAPYPIAWLDEAPELDELEGELADELEAMDAELA